MTDRIVRTTLQLVVGNYIEGMDRAAKATAKTATEAQKLEKQGQAFTTIGSAAVKMGVVAASAIALAVVRFAEFDQAISQVQAATQATAADMDLLRDAALEAGASTVYTATEAANAIEELGKAGLTTAQIIEGGLAGALTLAAAGGIDVAEAAQSMATSLKQFDRDGDDASHIADLLAAGAGKAVGSVDDLSQALNQAGLIAHGAGFSIEETTGVLAAFADAGLLGSDAGTSLKTAIVALQAPTGKAAELLEKYQINVYDTNGQMLGFADIAGQLAGKLGGLDEKTRNAALATIFGTDALRSANVLYNLGADGIQKYIDQTNDSGYASKVAADRLNNLAGDVEKLGGSFDTNLIKAGSAANDSLRAIVQGATVLLDIVGDIPEPLYAVGTAFSVVTAAMLLTGGGLLTLPAKFTALKATIAATNVSMGGFAIKTALVGGAIGIATLALGFFIAREAAAQASADEFRDSLDQTTGALTGYSRELIAKKLAEKDAFDQAEAAGISQKELTDAIFEGGDAYEAVKAKIEAYRQASVTYTNDGMYLQNTVTGVNDELAVGRERFNDIKAATDGAADSTQTAAEKYQMASEKVTQLEGDLRTLLDTINKANGVGQDAVSTNAAYQQALADVAEYVKNAQEGVEGYALGLDESTAAGSANADMLKGLASDSQAAAEAQLLLDGNTDAYLATMNAGRQNIIDTAIALGANAENAQLLADKIYAIPTTAQIQFLVDQQQLIETDALLTRILGQATSLQNVPHYEGSILVYPTLLASPKIVDGRADGGAISGPGTGTSDQAGLFKLSNGEHVLTAEDVRRMGGQSGVYAFRDSLYGGYANGGAVQYAAASSGGGGTIYINAPIISDSGTLEGYVRGVAGEVTSLRFEREIGRASAKRGR